MWQLIEQFHFIRPLWLWGCLPVIASFIVLWRARRTDSGWYDIIDPSLIKELLDNPANKKTSRQSAWPLFAAAAGFCFCLAVLSGPSWEQRPEITEKKTDAIIIIADLTLSMHATDLAPSRLVRTRYKLLELLKQRKEGQTALIAYSGDAHTVSPLTDDTATIAALVPALSPEIMPSIGSNAVSAFQLANQLLENSHLSNAKILWLTDEILTHELLPIQELISRHKSHLLIFGVGTLAGGPIPLPSGKFVKLGNGHVVTAKLSRNLLKKLARQTGGRYLDLQIDNSDIEYALDESWMFSLAEDRSIESQSMQTDQVADSAISSYISNPEFDRWQDRGGWLALLLIPFMLLSFRKGWLLTVLIALPLIPIDSANAAPLIDFSWNDLWQTADQQAMSLAEQDQHKEAAETFKNKDWKGISEYRSGDYPSAVETFSDISSDQESPPNNENEITDYNSQDLSVSERHHRAARNYNQGHALARSGKLDQAIAAYDRALADMPKMTNAQRAKDIVEALKQQNEQQQNPSQDQQGDDQQGDESKEGESSDSQQQNSQQSSDSAEQSSDNSQSQQASSDNQESNSPSDRNSDNKSDDKSDSTEENMPSESTGDQEDLSEQQMAQQAAEEAADKARQLASATLSPEEALNSEQKAKLDQWLNKIPDDPGGLLRRKFSYERKVREEQGKFIDRRENAQIW